MDHGWIRTHAAARMPPRLSFAIEYGPAHELWGVRRFFVRDPFGKRVNLLQYDPGD